MPEAVVLVVVVVVAVVIFVVWPRSRYQSGTVATTTSWTFREVADSLISYFVPDGWQVEHRGEDLLILKQGATGCAALVWLVVFFPLGLVYLLTDWSRGKLTARFWKNRDGVTEVELCWSNALIRRQIGRVLEGLAKEEETHHRPSE